MPMPIEAVPAKSVINKAIAWFRIRIVFEVEFCLRSGGNASRKTINMHISWFHMKLMKIVRKSWAPVSHA